MKKPDKRWESPGPAPSASLSSVTAGQHVIPSPTSGPSSRHCGSPRQLPKQPHSSYLFPGQLPVSGAWSTPVHGGHRKEGAGGRTDGKSPGGPEPGPAVWTVGRGPACVNPRVWPRARPDAANCPSRVTANS